jgi:hypothetical protein
MVISKIKVKMEIEGIEKRKIDYKKIPVKISPV